MYDKEIDTLKELVDAAGSGGARRADVPADRMQRKSVYTAESTAFAMAFSTKLFSDV